MVVVDHMVAVQHLLGATAITAPFRTVEFDCRCHSSSLSHDACHDAHHISRRMSWRHMSSIVPSRRSIPPSAAFPFIVPAAGSLATASRCRRSHQRGGPQGQERAASTNALKIMRLRASTLCRNSGCHCTPQQNRDSGRYSASITPSSALAITASSSATSRTAW